MKRPQHPGAARRAGAALPLRLMPSLADAGRLGESSSLLSVLTASELSVAQLLRDARGAGGDLSYAPADASAEAADDAARALTDWRAPGGGGGGGGGQLPWLLQEIDILRDVVDAAACDLRVCPVPAVVLHKPFDRSSRERIAGLRTAQGGSPLVTADEMARAVRLLQGAVLYDAPAIDVLRAAMNALLIEKKLALQRRPFGEQPAAYSFYNDLSVDWMLMYKRLLRQKLRAPDGGDGGGGGVQRLVGILSALAALQARQGQALNSQLRERHSTFGRFFTGPQEMRRLAERLRARLRPRTDVYVDFSCGTNEFGALLGLTRWVGFDIYPPATNACSEHFRWVNWFDVTDVPHHAVIGLNPPFGARGETASEFINHALTFWPRLLVLIVPTRAVENLLQHTVGWLDRVAALTKSDPAIQRWEQQKRASLAAGGGTVERHPALVPKHASRPPAYLLVDWDEHETKDAAFYMPGSLLSAVRAADRARMTASLGRRGPDWSGDYQPATRPEGHSEFSEGSVADRGIPIAPEDMPVWFVFQHAVEINDVAQVKRPLLRERLGPRPPQAAGGAG